MKSVFTDKKTIPTVAQLKLALGSTFEIWQALATFTIDLHPNAMADWHYTSEKYGWSFRVKDKKRVLVYLLPRELYFKTAFVFGQKATEAILDSSLSENIKKEIRRAKVYAEGRGIRIDVVDGSGLNDLQQLITIKIAN